MQLSSVIGQEEMAAHLLKTTQQNRVSHAQLFLGKAGYGGLPLALAYAQYLLCQSPIENDSCGNCSSCQKCQKLQHPDLHFSFPTVLSIAEKSDILLPKWREQLNENPYFNLNQWITSIDKDGRKPVIGTVESHEIIKKLSLKSFDGGYKILVMWMAEEMNVSCANKLLKILEEPPQKTIFILLCENIEHVLPTIISRAQLLKLNAIPTEKVIQKLKAERFLSDEAAKSVAILAAGDYAEACHILAQNESGSFNREQFIQFMRITYKKEVTAMLAWSEEMAATGRETQKLFLLYCLHLFRQSVLMNYTQEQLLQLTEEEHTFLLNFSKFITNNNIVDFMHVFSAAHYEIERNANAKILFTDLCFQVMRFIHAA